MPRHELSCMSRVEVPHAANVRPVLTFHADLSMLVSSYKNAHAEFSKSDP